MKLLIVALAALLTTAVGAGTSTNLVDIHKNAKANAAQCAGCHSWVVNQKSSDPKVKAFHPLHLESPQLKMSCVDCHKSVDLAEKSGANLRKQVDPAICADCHGPWSSKMDVAFQKMDCTKCHADWKQKMSKATTVNLENVTDKDCLGCHGGRPLFVSENSKRGG